MKKIVILGNLLLIVGVLLSCADSTKDNTVAKKIYSISPSDWTIGTWQNTTQGTTVKITKDNIVLTAPKAGGGFNTLDIKALALAAGLKPKETKKTDEYTVGFSMGATGGDLTQKFKRKTANTLDYTLNTAPTIVLTKQP